MNIKKFYFVGNAHIDPVWMWHWQDGSCETKATIRSALDRMKEYPEFKFVCAATQVYKWIQEFDPEMFEEIRQRVKEGRFIPVGGWFVQPDCNIPSGEAFARHSLYGQRYFYNQFGVTARTGYNVDSFGHHGMLPQILKKSGMDQYVALRPGPHEKELPGHVMRWISPDGSEVLFGRIHRAYQTRYVNIDDKEQLRQIMEGTDEASDPQIPAAMFFYGVGNHGGGPTKKNIESVLAARKDYPEQELILSDTEDFFDEVRKYYDKLPILRDDLQHHAPGCYSVVSAVKAGVRRAEWDLYHAETASMMAHRFTGKAMPACGEFEKAWENVLFTHFHDTLGGCSAKSTYDDADIMLKESRGMAQRTVNNALQTISWKVDTSEAGKGIPILFFNPHSFPVETVARVSKQIFRLYDSQGNEVPTQLVHGEDCLCRYTGTTGDTVFPVKIPAMGYAAYYFHAQLREPGSSFFYCPDVIQDSGVYPTSLQVDGPYAENPTVMENDLVKVTFSPRTGWITSMTDKQTGRELLPGGGAEPVVIDEFGYDTWAHGKQFFDQEIARFTDARIQVLERGPVRARVKVTNRYGNSTLEQSFILREGSKELEVEARVDWHEQHKQLKLRFHTACQDAPRAFYEIPFGVMERPADGEEEPGQSWIAVTQDGCGMALLNDSKYSFSIKGGDLNLTVLRSPYYNDHGRGDRDDPEVEYTDQGEQQFKYVLMCVEDQGWSAVTKRARLLNQGLTCIVENNHNGTLPVTMEGLSCTAENVVVSAIKRSEDGKGMILRAYETDGKPAHATFQGAMLPAKLDAVFTPYSVQTYFLPDGETAWREVLLTEFDCK